MTDSPAADEGLVKVVFDVPDRKGHVFKTESLWAEPLGNDTYRLRNVPFEVFGFSEQDAVTARESEGFLKVAGLAARGGHSTYRLVLPVTTSEEQFLQDWAPLQELGCTYERATRRFVAIDVPPASDIYAVYRLLEAGENANRWEFEEAHCGHLEHK
jgi:hypothetical protein